MQVYFKMKRKLTKELITEIYQILLTEMGPQGWWPADSKPEIILGAILVQNTNWRNVDRSLKNLRQASNFEPAKILQLSPAALMELIRPSGFYRQKAATIHNVFKWLDRYQWNYSKITTQFGTKLRARLLHLNGVGNETADVFLVYIFDQPVFIADNYARKLFVYLGYPAATYQQLQQQIKLPAAFTYQDAQELHGLLDEFGKNWLKNRAQFEQSFLAQRLKSIAGNII